MAMPGIRTALKDIAGDYELSTVKNQGDFI